MNFFFFYETLSYYVIIYHEHEYTLNFFNIKTHL